MLMKDLLRLKSETLAKVSFMKMATNTIFNMKIATKNARLMSTTNNGIMMDVRDEASIHEKMIRFRLFVLSD